MKKIHVLMALSIAMMAGSVQGASYSDNTTSDATIEVKKAPVPLTLVITPEQMTEKDYPNGTKFAGIKISTNNGSAQRLAVRFSPSSEFQTTEQSGTKTVLKGKNSDHKLPLYLVGEADEVGSELVNGVDMAVTNTNVSSFTFKAVLAGDHFVPADTYKVKVEGAVYNP